MTQRNDVAIRCHATDGVFKGFTLGDRRGVRHVREGHDLLLDTWQTLKKLKRRDGFNRRIEEKQLSR
jgi:hypothetical protein